MPIWAADLDGLEPDFKGSSAGQTEITSEQGSGDVYAWSWTGSGWHRGLKEVTKTGSKKGSTPKYTQEIPVGDGANWLTRATIATHSIDYKRDVSGLYTFADKTPEYWAHALELMFAAEGIVDLGLYLGRRGAMAVTAKGVTAEVEAGAVEAEVAARTSTEIITSNGIKITGFTEHGVNRAIGSVGRQGVSPSSILGALKNPLKINNVVTDQLGRQSQRFVGQFGEVVVNPQTGKIISVNPTSTSKAAKLLKQLGQ
jgi:hypothetical protein